MSKFWRYPILVVTSLALFISYSDVLAAELPRLNVDANDTPFVIKGTLDKKTTSFASNVRLTATGGEIIDLQMLASDLTNAKDKNVVIDRSNITISAGTSLSESQPRDVLVTVNNVTTPGQYKGNIKFLPSKQSRIKPLEIPLELDIDAEPNVVSIVDNLNIQLVRCQIDCGLATWLFPNSVINDQWAIQLDNQTLTPVKITGATAVMQGEKTNYFLNKDKIFFPSEPKVLAPQKVEPITLNIKRNQLFPDRYQGTIRLNLENADSPLKINAVITVRDSPILALIAIATGIFVGRLVQDMETPKAKRQVMLMPLYNKVKNFIKEDITINKQEDINFLYKRLEVIKQEIQTGEKDEEEIKTQIISLQEVANVFNYIATVENDLSNLDALRAKIKPYIDNVRNFLINNDFEKASQSCQQIEEKLEEAKSDGSMGSSSNSWIELVNNSFAKLTNLHLQSIIKPLQPGGKFWNWLAKLLVVLSGIQNFSADVRYWLIRPLLWLVLLIVLVLLGLQTLYVNAGATFGVNGLYDYLNLFLWGLSADIANQTLRRLQVGNEKEEEQSN
ncbi:hypothetical protein CAL7716_105340 (plasmid) [Calothrix sp. PCC 7716]|nr:hypothetical protein CAL7716_105340 [Calothrix sp. PCC 7716]